jgi:hypothetical protein
MREWTDVLGDKAGAELGDGTSLSAFIHAHKGSNQTATKWPTNTLNFAHPRIRFPVLLPHCVRCQTREGVATNDQFISITSRQKLDLPEQSTSS